jgi:kojibiose phosphorylase
MLAAWREMREKLSIKEPDPESKIIEQFDGFFDLEDTTPEQLAERLKDPGEYWGWPNGIATSTQVSKQADVVQLFMLHPNAYPEPVMRANWDYYEPRTQHGSSLSPSVYGAVAAWLGYTDLAYRYFLHSATVDLFSTNKSVSGGTFIGGIHTAACGAAWQMVVHGFLGMQVPQYGVIRFAPRLPEGWSRLALFLHAGEARFRVEVHGDTLRLELSRESGDGCTVQLGGQETHLEPGQSVSFAISAG